MAKNYIAMLYFIKKQSILTQTLAIYNFYLVPISGWFSQLPMRDVLIQLKPIFWIMFSAIKKAVICLEKKPS